MREERLWLAAAGMASFVVGVTAHAAKSPLSAILVSAGVGLIALAVLLPNIHSLTAKAGGFELSFTLVSARAVGVTDQTLAAGADVRGEAASTTGSQGFNELVNGPPLTYLIANLEQGSAWLTSRLYLFAALLEELRDLRLVVFTARSGTNDIFVGATTVSDLVTRLEWAYPWLPTAMFSAFEPHRTMGYIRTRLEADQAHIVFNNAVAALTQPGSAPPPTDWVHLPRHKRNEHAAWVTVGLLRQLAGERLVRTAVLPPADARALARNVIVDHTVDLVVELDDRHGVRGVIDRRGMVQRAISSLESARSGTGQQA